MYFKVKSSSLEIIEQILFCTKDIVIGAFSINLELVIILFNTSNKLSSSNANFSCGYVISIFKGTFPIPNLTKRKSSSEIFLSHSLGLFCVIIFAHSVSDK